MDRPSDYSFQVAISICARLAEGKSLRAICSEAGMPGRATVFRWIARHKEFRDEYTLARELRAEELGEEMLELIDDPSARLRFKALERQAARMAARKYGNRR
jgi:Bacteriophage Sf6, terminase small subunit-like